MLSLLCELGQELVFNKLLSSPYKSHLAHKGSHFVPEKLDSLFLFLFVHLLEILPLSYLWLTLIDRLGKERALLLEALDVLLLLFLCLLSQAMVKLVKLLIKYFGVFLADVDAQNLATATIIYCFFARL